MLKFVSLFIDDVSITVSLAWMGSSNLRWNIIRGVLCHLSRGPSSWFTGTNSRNPSPVHSGTDSGRSNKWCDGHRGCIG